jgi:hypothetical protein
MIAAVFKGLASLQTSSPAERGTTTRVSRHVQSCN